MATALPLALVQTAAHPAGETAGFVQNVQNLAEQRPNVRLMVYPELHLCGTEAGRPTARLEDLAEPIDGPRDRELAALAGDLGLWLVPGSVFERSDGAVYNTLPVYAPSGRRVAAYRKIAPWRPYETVRPGSDFVVFDMAPYGRVGLSICYDAWFPEIARHLAWMGADLILNVVQTPTIDREQETVLAPRHSDHEPGVRRQPERRGPHRRGQVAPGGPRRPGPDRFRGRRGGGVDRRAGSRRSGTRARVRHGWSESRLGPVPLRRPAVEPPAVRGPDRPGIVGSRPRRRGRGDPMTTEGPAGAGTTGRLVPRLGLISLVVFGLAYMSPSIVVSTFGVIASTSRGAAPTAYLVATAAMSLTALSYGKLARAYPASGSVYTYARKLLDARVGFLAGWALLLDYFFLPMVAWLITALYMNVQFPVFPVWGWLVVLIVGTTVVNTFGIVIADRVNKALLAITAVALVALVVVCAHKVGGAPAGAAHHSLWNSASSVGTITAAAAIAAYSFLGFDAISTLSEEVVDPDRNVPRGILLSVLIGGGIFFVLALLMQWVHPGGNFHDESTAGYAVATFVGGKSFADVFNILTLLGGLASCIAIQASTSRLMYVMGRDGVLPRRTFGYLHPTFRTPIFNLLLIAAAGLLATRLSLATATSFINFGAFLAFTVVNICVIAASVRSRRRQEHRPVFGYVVLPVLGAAIDVYLMTKLGPHAIFLGVGWLILGIIYLVVLTGGLRRDPPEFSLVEPTPPESVDVERAPQGETMTTDET